MHALQNATSRWFDFFSSMGSWNINKRDCGRVWVICFVIGNIRTPSKSACEELTAEIKPLLF
jgi:hypothetical protein